MNLLYSSTLIAGLFLVFTSVIYHWTLNRDDSVIETSVDAHALQPAMIDDNETAITTDTAPIKLSPSEQVKALDISNIPESTEQAYTAFSTTVSPEFMSKARSLEGTEIDGNILMNGEGDLLLTQQVRDAFDYFLNTVGEVEADAAIAELKAYMAARLSPQASAQAVELLEDYLSYKAAAIELLQQPLLPVEQQTREYQVATLKESLNQLTELRQQYFSSNATDAFFGAEQSYAEFTLASLEVTMNDQLTENEKAYQINELRRQLPEAMAEREQKTSKQVAIAQQTQHLMSQTNRDALEHHLRTHYSDEVAAQTLVDFDEHQQFNQQYQDYQASLAQQELSVDSEASKALREQYFTGHQKLLAETYDAIHKKQHTAQDYP